jgi:hypothetical protein
MVSAMLRLALTTGFAVLVLLAPLAPAAAALAGWNQ